MSCAVISSDRMSKENPLWGAPWIHGELLMLGFEVAQSTVSKYMGAGVGGRLRNPGGRFLRKPRGGDRLLLICGWSATLTFERLFAFLVLSHGRRRLTCGLRSRGIRQPSGWPDRSPEALPPGHRRRPILVRR